MLFLLIDVLIWFQTGVSNLFSDTEPLLEQLVFCGLIFGGLFAFVWLMAWQRIELHIETQTLRVASINTLYRWRTLHAKDIAQITHSSSKSLGRMLLSGAAGTRDLAILEDSFSAIEPSKRFKEIAGFIRTHHPDVRIAPALNRSS